jgi:hypothetical protein
VSLGRLLLNGPFSLSPYHLGPWLKKGRNKECGDGGRGKGLDLLTRKKKAGISIQEEDEEKTRLSFENNNNK